MAASFPNTKKTFSQVVNGVNKLIAALFNQPYDEIEAIETYLGAIGSAQSYSESLKNLLIGYRNGCNVFYKGTADIYVKSGEIAIPDASGNVRLRRNPSDTTVTWANLDTGSEANSTQYFVYAVADGSGTTFTVKISTSATAPTGCTYYVLIGTFYNNSSGDIVNGMPENVVLLAPVDGLFTGLVSKAPNNADWGCYITGYTDASNPPTTVRGYAAIMQARSDLLGSAQANSFCFRVKKGNYFKAVFTDQKSASDATRTYFFDSIV